MLCGSKCGFLKLNTDSKYMEKDVIYLQSQKLIVAALSAASSKRSFMIWGFILKNVLCAQERVKKWQIRASGY